MINCRVNARRRAIGIKCFVCGDGPCMFVPRPIPLVNYWASDYGDIRLPADFPLVLFRRDGWWDGRYKALREKWEAWIAAEEVKLRHPLPTLYQIPNRLHGAAVNAEGDAI